MTWVTPGFHGSLAALEFDGHCGGTAAAAAAVVANAAAAPKLNSGGAVGVQSGLLLDHRFSVIKHDNDRFQVVQGYIAHAADDGGLAEAQGAHLAHKEGWWSAPEGTHFPLRGRFSTPGFTAGDGSAGFGLMGWQGTTLGASMGQFSRKHMQASLLLSLRGFAENESFDASGCAELFLCFSSPWHTLVRSQLHKAHGGWWGTACARYEAVFGVRHAGGQQYWSSISYRELIDHFIVGHGERPVAEALESALPTEAASP
eukprot:SAG11_NODE_2503_length_3278_cov_1.735451_2_plen_258_part_00